MAKTLIRPTEEDVQSLLGEISFSDSPKKAVPVCVCD